jgi:UPF0755 protein
MSGPRDSDASDASDGIEDEDEFPWPRPEPEEPSVAAPDAENGAPSRAGRKAARLARLRRRRRVVALIGGALLFLILAFTLWYQLESNALGPPGPQVVVTVQQGESANSVISSLSQQHVIGSSLAFRVSDVFDGSPTVIPGSYALHQNQTFGEVRAILAAGPNIYPVDVRPGLSLAEVASRVDGIQGHVSGQFARVAASGVVHSEFSPPGSNNLEGLLGTGTYLVLPGESDTTILRDMVQRFDQVATAQGLSAASASAHGLTPYEVVIVASIVEKEGYFPPSNFPPVARVIYNRLAQDIPLQMDSTVLYALGQDGGPVTSQDLKIQSPYNTYLNHGLTPTPTCMPSPQALAAALHPAVGNWLYFVLVKKDGTEAFSDTLAGQQANEQLAKSRGLP